MFYSQASCLHPEILSIFQPFSLLYNPIITTRGTGVHITEKCKRLMSSLQFLHFPKPSIGTDYADLDFADAFFLNTVM